MYNSYSIVNMDRCVYAYTCVCIACKYVYVYVDTYIYVCICVYMYNSVCAKKLYFRRFEQAS